MQRGGGGRLGRGESVVTRKQLQTHVSDARVPFDAPPRSVLATLRLSILISRHASSLSKSAEGFQTSLEVPPSLVDKVNVVAENPLTRSCPTKNNQRKVPKRVHKAVREKLKREHLHDLFLELANALDLTHQNTGKAFILCEAIRLVKDTIAQIDCLKKENAALFSESHYVNIEKNELRDENSVLEDQIDKLQTEIKERAALYKPDLNSAPSEFQQTEVTQHCPGSSLRFPSADQALQQSSVVGPVLVVPFASGLRAYPGAGAPRSISIVSKPHARYPTPGDSWPSQVLGDQPTARQKFELSGSINNSSSCGIGEEGSGKV